MSNRQVKRRETDGSTDTLFIEWALVPSVGSPPDLRVTPTWRQGHPIISLSFEATLLSGPSVMSLGAILPQDWGWHELEIRGDGLLGWRSSGESSGVLASTASAYADVDPDSTATLDDPHDLHGLSTPPPDHQVTLAHLGPDDFSFELESMRADSRPRPVTPSIRRSITAELAQASLFKVRPRAPVHATSFELEFEDDDGEEDRVVIVRGVLAPLPLTLVPPEAKVEIPFIRFLDASLPTRAAVVCPGATFCKDSSDEGSAVEGARLCEVWKPSIGTFSWGEEATSKNATAAVHGPVKIVVQRNIWGLQTVALAFQWPEDAHDVTFRLPTKTARVVRATSLGRQIPRSTAGQDGEVQVRLAGGRGIVEVVLEAVDAEGVALPSFPEGNGEVAVELVGPGWDSECTATTGADVGRNTECRAEDQPQAHRRVDIHWRSIHCATHLVHPAANRDRSNRDKGLGDGRELHDQEPLAPNRLVLDLVQLVPTLRSCFPGSASPTTSQRSPIHRR